MNGHFQIAMYHHSSSSFFDNKKNDKGDSLLKGGKKKRVRWNEELHLIFVEAIRLLEIEEIRVVPVQILREMKKLAKDPHIKYCTSKLTREQIASHLQKHRSELQTNRLTTELVRRGSISSDPISQINYAVHYYSPNSGAALSTPASPSNITSSCSTTPTPSPAILVYESAAETSALCLGKCSCCQAVVEFDASPPASIESESPSSTTSSCVDLTSLTSLTLTREAQSSCPQLLDSKSSLECRWSTHTSKSISCRCD